MAMSESNQRLVRIAAWVVLLLGATGHAVMWGLFFFAGGLVQVVGFILVISIVPLTALPSLIAGVAFFAFKRRWSSIAAGFLVLGLGGMWPAAWLQGAGRIAFPSKIYEKKPVATVRLPSQHSLRVVWGGDALEHNYHAFSPDQRWAYDLVVEPAGSGSKKLEDYGCFGTDIVAPIDSVVQGVQDGLPDVEPGNEPSNPEQALGNHVVLKLDTDTFLIIAHFKKGSVRVAQGDHLRAGQIIAQCGNSGNTSEPHIHMHHQRQDPTQLPPSFAEGLPLYFEGHDGAAMPRGGVQEDGGKAIFTGAIVRHVATSTAGS